MHINSGCILGVRGLVCPAALVSQGPQRKAACAEGVLSRAVWPLPVLELNTNKPAPSPCTGKGKDPGEVRGPQSWLAAEPVLTNSLRVHAEAVGPSSR